MKSRKLIVENVCRITMYAMTSWADGFGAVGWITTFHVPWRSGMLKSHGRSQPKRQSHLSATDKTKTKTPTTKENGLNQAAVTGNPARIRAKPQTTAAMRRMAEI